MVPMFRVKASFKDELEINAPLEQVRQFFCDLNNFVELMPGIESIHREPGGVARWNIGTDAPIGRVRFSFPVRQTDNRRDSIEWLPAESEDGNLLRYAVSFKAHGGKTLVRIVQHLELRRRRARNLHPALALIGEGPVNVETRKRVTEAIETFLARAREKLEGNNPQITQIT